MVPTTNPGRRNSNGKQQVAEGERAAGRNGGQGVSSRAKGTPGSKPAAKRGRKAAAGPGLVVERRWTTAGVDPFDAVEWDYRTAAITGEKGETIFEQREVEVPRFWSQLATNVVVSKYFRGHLGDPAREHSVKQLIGRVVGTISGWGRDQGYFASEADAGAFRDELCHMMLHQKAAFNSPVWFNVGLPDNPRPQASACFINSVQDTMESIMELAATEARLFKGGSGAGSNLSRIRSSREPLQGGGIASGPVSFMRGYDSFAGVIKCLTPDAYVYTEQGLRSLGEIIDPDLAVGFHADESLVLASKDGPARISHVYVSPEAPTFRLKLQHTGLSLRGTGDHPVLTLTPEFELEWRSLSDLAPGDRVAVSRGAEMWPAEAPSFHDFQPVARQAKKSLDYPSQMTPELARLLGYMVAEGCLDDGRFRFSNADDDVFEDFLACVRSVFGVDPVANVSVSVHPTTGVATRRFEACWTNAVRFLKHVGLTAEPSAAKGVPWSIRCSPRPLVVEFLRAYFEGDGHISHHVYAASASEQLLREVQLLLLNMRMVPQLRPHRVNGKTYWCLYLRGEQACAFVREVGFVSSRKQAASEFAGDKNTDIDVVPFLVDVLRSYAKRNKYFECSDGVVRSLGFGFFNRMPGCGISYNRLRSTPSLIENVRTIDPARAETLEVILEQEFFWDAVHSVESDDPAVTYDFTVPDTHSFVANGIVNHNSGGKTRRAAKMQILDIDHPDVVEFIKCKASEEKKAWALIDAGYDGGFNVPGGAYDSVFFQNANLSVRASDEFMHAVQSNGEWSTRLVLSKEPADTYKARDLMRMIAEGTHVCGDPGMQFDTIINRWHTCKATDRIYASNPCSEYMFLDDSACNLASLNLLRFRREDSEFDVEEFVHGCEVLITAQEILVDNASYPTEKIAINSHDFRPLGLGYANLGALLMARGLPYDSDAGRAMAGAITAVMTGAAYRQSARIAEHKEPFPGYAPNREAMLEVMALHRSHIEQIDHTLVPGDLMAAAHAVWDETLELGRKHGYKNAQISVLAPTGTIAFLMDCDTTGIEPDIALVKYKTLVGGGVMKIVNQTVPEALRRLGYSTKQVSTIVDYIDASGTIEGAPGLRDEDLPVFDCAFRAAGGTRSIHYMGHIRMMAAAQPFISGAISKTVNVPEDATVEEIERTYLEAWKEGLKAVAIYRDNSKRTQPLSTKLGGDGGKVTEARPYRRKLPDERQSITHKFSIAGHEGYVTVGMYEDHTPGEIFITMSKEGSTISGLMDSFATAISLALQYGVPLPVLVSKFSHARFEPAGWTNNKEIPIAKSVMDYIFRWLALKFHLTEAVPAPEATMTNGHVKEADALVPSERMLLQEDAPPCSDCGSIMVRAGACYRCLNCGSTSGCG